MFKSLLVLSSITLLRVTYNIPRATLCFPAWLVSHSLMAFADLPINLVN